MKVGKRILSAVLAAAMALALPFGAFAAGEKTTGEDYSSYLDFPQFRGSTLSQGIVDSKTPVAKSDIEQKWKAKFGSGWFVACGTPVIVNGYMYVLATTSKTLNRVSLADGSVLKSEACPGESQFFSMIGYGDGKLFVPRAVTVDGKSAAVVCVYDEQTMKLLWTTEPIGGTEGSIQPLSAVTYYEGRIYVGVSDSNASKGLYACYTTEDPDPASSSETKAPLWTYQPESGKMGYYWSAAAVVDNAIVFGGESSEVVLHSLSDSTVYDTYNLGHGGIRSTLHFDKETRRVYVTTKDGYVCSLKVNGDNTFDRNSYVEKKIGGDITSSPVVFKGRLYVGGGGISSGDGFTVMNAETLEIIYQIKDVKTQGSPILSTAYATEENGWEVRMYVTNYERPSSLYVVTDKQGQTAGRYEELVAPDEVNYCTQSVAIDQNGGIYYYNDSGNMFAFGHKDARNGAFTAEDVVNSIGLIESGGALTAGDEYAVKRAKARYDALDPTEQAKVGNYTTLETMLTRIEALKDVNTVVDELNTALAALDPDTVTLVDDAEINALLTRYNGLSAEAKQRVQGVDKLTAAVEKLQGLKDTAMIAELNSKIAALPVVTVVSLDDRAKVEQLALQLDNQNDIVKAGVDASKLNVLLQKLKEIGQAVNTLSARIFSDIDPMNVTLADKAVVEALVKAYEALGVNDRKYVQYYDDVLYAQKVIAELEQGKVLPDVFENLVGSDKTYTVPGKTENGKDYTITFNGMDITDPTIGFDAGISLTSKNDANIKKLAADAVVVSFAHSGALPGKATIELAVDLADGTYYLYYYNEAAGKPELADMVTVKDGKATFSITHCSDYFISAQANLADSPRTGDTAVIPLLLAVMLLSGAAALTLRKKTRGR